MTAPACPGCAHPEVPVHLPDCPRQAELEEVRARIPAGGHHHYQVRVELPGGAVMLCGASGLRRDWVRQDMARLLRKPERHITVSRIRPPDVRPRP